MHHIQIDRLSFQDSPIHRLDGRVKLIATIIFSVCVISLPPAAVSILACYIIWPFAIITIARLPLKFVLKQLLIVSPFIAVLAVSSIWYDRTQVTVTFGPAQWQTTVGTLRCFSIMGKFIVTMTALIALVATTRFADLLAAMSKLAVPKLLIMQLGFLHRYIFMLTEKAHRIIRARTGRTLRNLGPRHELKTAAAMIGTLCVSSIDSASRINIAMQARGFKGELRTMSKMKIKPADYLYLAVLAVFLTALYFIRKNY
jgi:cobalt/nickel transport system permease protein